MQKKLQIVFITICLVLCSVPFAGMLFVHNGGTVGNEIAASKPQFKDENGKINIDFISDAGKYFEKNFAFRPQIITADALIQSEIFATSNTDTVTVGKNNWMYYSSTNSDFLGRDTLTKRQINGVVNNLEIIRDCAENYGANFLFTIAPNKNTLYSDNMPYYFGAKSDKPRNKDNLISALNNTNIDYCDLFSVFQDSDEVLYFARDSHWNNKGALLAYNEILTHLGKNHDDFSSVSAQQTLEHSGDLEKMIYPSHTVPEYDYDYNAENKYKYITDTKSTEDPLIKTESFDGSEVLYMYRDSFGNALVPFFAGAYETSVFTKSFPMVLDMDLKIYKPDTVIFEIVERNINWLITMPPITAAPQIDGLTVNKGANTRLEVKAAQSEYSPMYIEVFAEFSFNDATDDASIYITVNGTKTYKCFYYLNSLGKEGCLAYLPTEEYKTEDTMNISVIMQQGDSFVKLGTKTVTIGGNNND